MDRYELVEGGSSKFWEVGVEGPVLTVRFGRIGTAGQVKDKAFADADAALRERDKLVREKTGKGYRAVGAAGAASLAGPAEPTVVEAPRAHDAAPVIPVSAPSAPGPITWPTAGVEWRKDWTDRLPILRGIRSAPLPPHTPVDPARLLPEPDRYGHQQRDLSARAAAARKPWSLWSRDETAARVTEATLAQADLPFWVELLSQVASTQARVLAPALLREALERHGLAFALPLAVHDGAISLGCQWSGRQDVGLLMIRQAVAVADDATYTALEAQAESLRALGSLHQRACALVFAHRGDWAAALAEEAPQWWERKLVLTCAFRPDDFVRLLRCGRNEFDDTALQAMLLQVRLHGLAAMPVLDELLGQAVRDHGATAVAEVLKVLLRLHDPAQVRVLAAHVADRKVREALEKLAESHPAAVLQSTIPVVLRAGDRALEGWLQRLALQHPEALALAIPDTEPALRTRLAALTRTQAVAEAADDALPPLLREPPWLRPGGRVELPVIDVPPAPVTESIALTDEITASARAWKGQPWYGKYLDAHGFAKGLGLTDSGAAEVLRGEPLGAGGVREWHGREAQPGMVAIAPPQARLALWNSYPGKHWSRWPEDEALWHLMLTLGMDAMPGFASYVQAQPERGPILAQAVESPLLVDWMLALMQRGKTREIAARWLRAYPATTLRLLLPRAFQAKAEPSRDAARRAIRWLADEGHARDVERIAAPFGPPMIEATRLLLAMDPLALLPAKLPKLPAWFVPASLHRPVLAAGGALPLAAVTHIGTMLAISDLASPYAGLAVVKQACTPASLGEFAWDVLEAWQAAGCPPKEAWALAATGLLGDDMVARRLAARIREWHDQSAPSRAVGALDALAAIGSDVALMHLNAFTRQARLKPLQKRAAAMIAEVAEARGLTEWELADRLVPTLELDEAGALELDFGPRRFHLRFDEALLPYVTDAAGQRLKVFPRATKADDAALAKAATERYKHIRKELEGIASLQVNRLEQAMVQRRRWQAADWRLLFLTHPLMRHLAARLVWGVCEGDAVRAAFRIAEDWSLADATDSLFTLPDDAVVGLPHELELPAAERDAFAHILADYEIAQPFRQLGRETYALTPPEQDQPVLARFDGRRVATPSVLSLNHRGWSRLDVGDYQAISYGRDLPGGLRAELRFTPGIPFGDAKSEPVQTLGALRLWAIDAATGKGRAVPWRQAGELAASEVLRDITLLPAARE